MFSSYRHAGFADVQISRCACKHPRVLSHVSSFCPALLPSPRHPTQTTVAHSAGPARSEHNSERIATGKRVKTLPRERQPNPQILCNSAYTAASLIYCSNARTPQCFALQLVLFCDAAQLAYKGSLWQGAIDATLLDVAPPSSFGFPQPCRQRPVSDWIMHASSKWLTQCYLSMWFGSPIFLLDSL